MNWNQIAGEWKQFSGKVQEKWGKLTDDEVTEIAGRREQLIGYLQERYGYEKACAEKEIDDFTQTMISYAAQLEMRQQLPVTQPITVL